MVMTELALLLALALGAEKSVCVPNDTGEGWDCGKGEATPAPRSLPRAATQREASRPPMYLMNPEQMPQLVRESLERGDYATAEAASERLPPPPPIRAGEPTANASAAPPADASASSAATLPDTDASTRAPEPAVAIEPAPSMSAPEATPPDETEMTAIDRAAATATDEQTPILTETTTSTAAAEETSATTVGPALPAAAPTSDAVATAATVSQSPAATAPAPEAVAAVDPNRPARSISSTALGAADLLALPPDHYTVQLTASRSLRGFTELRQQLQLAVEDTFVIHVKRGGEDWWLMLWRTFPDVASARSAAALIGTQALWPRRLGPLQTEVRAAQGKGAGPQS